MYPFLYGPQNDAYLQRDQQMHYESSDAAEGVRGDEDAAVDQDEAAYENGDVGSRVDDEDGVEQEVEQDGHLLSCLYRTLSLYPMINCLSQYINRYLDPIISILNRFAQNGRIV